MVQVPFEHESLLIDQKEELDESEKELAMRGMTLKLNHHVVHIVVLVEYEKERSDSNQKYKTAPPPSGVRCVQSISLSLLV